MRSLEAEAKDLKKQLVDAQKQNHELRYQMDVSKAFIAEERVAHRPKTKKNTHFLVTLHSKFARALTFNEFVFREAAIKSGGDSALFTKTFSQLQVRERRPRPAIIGNC